MKSRTDKHHTKVWRFTPNFLSFPRVSKLRDIDLSIYSPDRSYINIANDDKLNKLLHAFRPKEEEIDPEVEKEKLQQKLQRIIRRKRRKQKFWWV